MTARPPWPIQRLPLRASLPPAPLASMVRLYIFLLCAAATALLYSLCQGVQAPQAVPSTCLAADTAAVVPPIDAKDTTYEAWTVLSKLPCDQLLFLAANVLHVHVFCGPASDPIGNPQALNSLLFLDACRVLQRYIKDFAQPQPFP